MQTAEYLVAIARHETDGIPFYLFSPPESAAAPLVVVLHGLNSRKERLMEVCLRLTAAGRRVCALDLRGHGERVNDDTQYLRRDWSDPMFAPAIARVVLDGILDVASVVTDLGASRYTILGHSLGGYVALLTALEDSRVAAVCCMSGALDISALPPAPGADSSRYDPARRASELAQKPVFLLHGTDDLIVPIAGARRLWGALTAAGIPRRDSALREFPGVGHELTPAMMTEAVEWIRRVQ